MNWVPSNDFENEVVSQQPDHNFIFGSLADSDTEEYYPRPESHLLYAEEKRLRKLTTSFNPKLDIIAKVQRIAGTKPLGQQPTIDDWDDTTNVERETIAMMRNAGINSSIERPLDEKLTVATLPVTEEMHVMHNGKKRMPIFYHDKFFKFKPRISNVSPIEDSTDSVDSLGSAKDQSLHSSSISTSADDSMQIEKHNFSTADESSFKVLRSATVETESAEESYTTAYSRDYVPSRSWFSGDNGRSNDELEGNRSSDNWRVRSPLKNSRNSENWRVRSPTQSNSSSQNTSSTNNSMVEFPPLPTKPNRTAASKQGEPQRFYTAKELYKKNRRN